MHFGKGSLLLLAPKMFNVHASAAEIHPAVADNLSAVSVPGVIVVACFPAVAEAQVSLLLLLLLAFLLLLLLISLLLLGGIPPVAGFHTD
jgi:hypothetical protein